MGNSELLPLVLRRGIDRGVFGGSRRWTIIAAVAGGLTIIRRMSDPPRQIVVADELFAGDGIEVIVHPPPARGRKARRAAKKTAEADARHCRRR
jgi:hypothetical protein